MSFIGPSACTELRRSHRATRGRAAVLMQHIHGPENGADPWRRVYRLLEKQRADPCDAGDVPARAESFNTV